MKLNELLCKMLDNYVEIIVYECNGIERNGKCYSIKPHTINFEFVPNDVWNANVQFIIPYHDRIAIDIKKEEHYESFIDDKEKILDFFEMNKEDFLESYSYLTEEEYDLTMEDVKKKKWKWIQFKFDWSEFSEEKYNFFLTDFHKCDTVGFVRVGDLCIDFTLREDEDAGYLDWDLYVGHEDTGYGHSKDGVPYDYVGGGTVNIYPSYEMFKLNVESEIVEFIENYDGASYSLIEHANKPLEIW